MKQINWVIRIILFIVILYIGSGAYTQWNLYHLSQAPIPPDMADSPINFGGEDFDDPISAALAFAENERDRLYRWAVFLKPWQAIGLLASACGGCGGFLREAIVSVQHPEQTRLNWMYLGLIMGPAILLGVISIGGILFEGEQLRIGSVVALTFLGGCFSEESFDFLQSIYGQMRKTLLK